MKRQHRERLAGAAIVTSPSKSSQRLRQRMVMTWAALAGLAAAAAFSSLVGDGGRIAQLLGPDNGGTMTAELPPEARPAVDGSPMATGSLGGAGRGSVPALKAEIARLETAVRRGEIEKKALLKRIAEMRGGSDPIRDIVTGSLPKSAAGGIAATSAPMPAAVSPASADAPDVRMHEAMSNSMAAEFAHAQTKVTETLFAVEVASGQTLSALRSRWSGLSQAHPALLEDFDPVINVREDEDGLSLHLLAGPVRNAADAVDLCARLRNSGTVCAAVPYDGQRLLGNN